MMVLTWVDASKQNKDPYRKMEKALEELLNRLPTDAHGKREISATTGLSWFSSEDKDGDKVDLYFLSPFQVVWFPKYPGLHSESKYVSGLYLVEDQNRVVEMIEEDAITNEFLEKHFIRVDSADHYLYNEAVEWIEKVAKLIEPERLDVEQQRKQFARQELDKIGTEVV